MNTTDLFAAALNLPEPWSIAKVEFKPDLAGSMELHIEISFPRGSKFSCPECGTETAAYDTKPRTWRHLNFFQYKTYIHADLPRINCGEHGVKTISVPWARKGSGFTLLFEGWVVELAKHLPVATIAGMVDEHDTRLWRFIKHYVDEARSREDYSNVTAIGIDETSKKGHKYVTVVVDLNQRKVIYVTNGKDSTTVDRFAEDFAAHKGDAEAIKIVTCDMSLGFKKGINEHFVNSSTVIDKFHAVQEVNRCLDKTRIAIQKDLQSKGVNIRRFKKSKYLFMTNWEDLSEEGYDILCKWFMEFPDLYLAYMTKESFRDIYNLAKTRAEATEMFDKWLSTIPDFVQFGAMKKTMNQRREHLLNYWDAPYTNAYTESVNNLIKKTEKAGRGYKFDTLRERCMLEINTPKPDKFNPKTARFFDEEGIEQTLTAKADKLYMSAIPSDFKEQTSLTVNGYVIAKDSVMLYFEYFDRKKHMESFYARITAYAEAVGKLLHSQK